MCCVGELKQKHTKTTEKTQTNQQNKTKQTNYTHQNKGQEKVGAALHLGARDQAQQHDDHVGRRVVAKRVDEVGDAHAAGAGLPQADGGDLAEQEVEGVLEDEVLEAGGDEAAAPRMQRVGKAFFVFGFFA